MSELLNNLMARAAERCDALERLNPNMSTHASEAITIARFANGDLLTALARLRELEVTSAEERAAWDRYASCAPCADIERCAKHAEDMLELRRKRFGGAK